MRHAVFLLMLMAVSGVAEARCGRCRSGGWRRSSCQRVGSESAHVPPVYDRSLLLENSDDRYELWVHRHGFPGPDPMMINDGDLPGMQVSVEIDMTSSPFAAGHFFELRALNKPGSSSANVQLTWSLRKRGQRYSGPVVWDSPTSPKTAILLLPPLP